MTQHADLDEHERQEQRELVSHDRLRELLDTVQVVDGNAIVGGDVLDAMSAVYTEALVLIRRQREALDHIEYLATHGSAGDTRARILAIIHEGR